MNKCCICSAVKDVGRFLPKVVANMKTLGTVFDDYVMIFFHDKSSDDTWQVLESLKRENPNMIVIDNPTPLESGAPRTYKIAHGLGAAPEMIIGKNRENSGGYNWSVFFGGRAGVVADRSQSADHYLELNTTDAYADNPDKNLLSVRV